MKNTKIEWCDHTVNTHLGCQKIGQGCKSCYAESMANRFPRTRGLWEPGGTRQETKDWKKELKRIQRLAVREGRVHTVFINSMSDIFEDDRPLMDYLRNPTDRTIHTIQSELMPIIAEMPELVFLLLTKRPENVEPRLKALGVKAATHSNLWIGTSISTQKEAAEQLRVLRGAWQGKVFISMEPMVEMIDMERSINMPTVVTQDCILTSLAYFDWVIVGGESGKLARPMHPDWPLAIRDQCKRAQVPFFFKQWGRYYPWWKDGDYRVNLTGQRLSLFSVDWMEKHIDFFPGYGQDGEGKTYYIEDYGMGGGERSLENGLHTIKPPEHTAALWPDLVMDWSTPAKLGKQMMIKGKGINPRIIDLFWRHSGANENATETILSEYPITESELNQCIHWCKWHKQ